MNDTANNQSFNINNPENQFIQLQRFKSNHIILKCGIQQSSIISKQTVRSHEKCYEVSKQQNKVSVQAIQDQTLIKIWRENTVYEQKIKQLQTELSKQNQLMNTLTQNMINNCAIIEQLQKKFEKQHYQIEQRQSNQFKSNQLISNENEIKRNIPFNPQLHNHNNNTNNKNNQLEQLKSNEDKYKIVIDNYHQSWNKSTKGPKLYRKASIPKYSQPLNQLEQQLKVIHITQQINSARPTISSSSKITSKCINKQAHYPQNLDVLIRGKQRVLNASSMDKNSCKTLATAVKIDHKVWK